MAGKGDRPRPKSVTDQAFTDRWVRTFGTPSGPSPDGGAAPKASLTKVKPGLNPSTTST
jgi:hypothetical protein